MYSYLIVAIYKFHRWVKVLCSLKTYSGYATNGKITATKQKTFQ
jgi:hypothetical protein